MPYCLVLLLTTTVLVFILSQDSIYETTHMALFIQLLLKANTYIIQAMSDEYFNIAYISTCKSMDAMFVITAHSEVDISTSKRRDAEATEEGGERG